MVDRGFGENAVTKIEDMSGTAVGLIQDGARATANLGGIGKQRDGIEISLNCNVVTIHDLAVLA